MSQRTTIPLVDLELQHGPLRHEINQAIQTCLDGNAFIGGQEPQRFAEEFAELCGGGVFATCGNGTDALLLALLAVLGRGEGHKEIITSTLSFAATAESIVNAGYTPVFVDVDPTTGLMDLNKVEEALGPNTAGIVPVHLYGQMVDMERLSSLATAKDLVIIEDAAQAHGASWNGFAPGQSSSAACFSFFPGKNLGALGDGGGVLSADPQTAKTISRLANHGRGDKYHHTAIGVNSRLDAIQAAVLRVKLKHLKTWNEQRKAAAQLYDLCLKDCPNVLPLEKHARADHVYHLYVVRVDKRDHLLSELRDHGIQAGIHYPIPLHDQPAFSAFRSGDLPAAEKLCSMILSLPIFPGISEDQIIYISDVLRQSTGSSL